MLLEADLAKISVAAKHSQTMDDLPALGRIIVKKTDRRQVMLRVVSQLAE